MYRNRLVSTAPAQLTQDYYDCYPTASNAFFNALGIASGNTQLVVPLTVLVTIPLIYLFLVLIQQVPPKEEYTALEKEEVMEIVSIILLRLRDGKTRGFKKNGVLVKLTKELIKAAKEDVGYPDSDDDDEEDSDAEPEAIDDEEEEEEEDGEGEEDGEEDEDEGEGIVEGLGLVDIADGAMAGVIAVVSALFAGATTAGSTYEHVSAFNARAMFLRRCDFANGNSGASVDPPPPPPRVPGVAVATDAAAAVGVACTAAPAAAAAAAAVVPLDGGRFSAEPANGATAAVAALRALLEYFNGGGELVGSSSPSPSGPAFVATAAKATDNRFADDTDDDVEA